MLNKFRIPQDPEQKNTDRSEWARQALEEFERATHMRDGDMAEALTDLFADLAHLCDREQIDFAQCMYNASSLYEEETGEDGQQFERIGIIPVVSDYILPKL